MKKVSLILAVLMAFVLVASCAAAEEADPVLLAYYPFDGIETLGDDLSGNGNNIVKVVNPEGMEIVEGVKGGAVYFGGASGMMPFDDANNDFIDIYAQTGKALTVSFYAKVDTERAVFGGNARAISSGIQGSDEGFVVLVNASKAEDGTVSLFSISKVGGSDWWGSASVVPSDPEGWHHYVMVYDAENEKVVTFIDGEQIVEVYADSEEVIGSAFTFCIGGSWAQWDWFNGGNFVGSAEGFTGTIDEVKVFAGAVYEME
ncbi:MAG: hypothetical protein CW338_08825, partial [Clostridiales bacterium]|nr:hypothetical protein [Clostridiales bacterium]